MPAELRERRGLVLDPGSRGPWQSPAVGGMLWGPAPASSCAGSVLAGLDPDPKSPCPGAGSPRQGVSGARLEVLGFREDGGDAPPLALPHALNVPASCGAVPGCGCGGASSSCAACLRRGHAH